MKLRLAFIVPVLSWFSAGEAFAAEPMLVVFDEVVAPAQWSMVQAGGACEARLEEHADAVSGEKVLRWKWKKPEEAWGGWGTPIVHRRDSYNFTPFLDRTVLRFHLKGEDGYGGVGVLLKDTKGNVAEWTLEEEGSETRETPGGWREYSLPLRRTEIEAAGVDVSEIAELIFSAPAKSVAGDFLVDFVHVVEVPDLAVYAGVAPEGAVVPAVGREAASLSAAAAGEALLVDDFSRRKMENLLGGEWGAFSAGDQGDVYAYVTEVSPGEFALEAEGTLPNYGGNTWAGVYSQLSPAGSNPVDLRKYSTLRFRVRTDHPGDYRVRIENPINKYESANVEFAADSEFREISIPLSAFATGVGQATTIVWTLSEEKIGDPFHLVLDHVRFEP